MGIAAPHNTVKIAIKKDIKKVVKSWTCSDKK